MKKIAIDPITRIEGHLKVELVVEDGVIREARSSGALYRGLEQILVGRHPLDAQKITQRICGVCPLAHSTAASLCLDDALDLDVPPNGRLLSALILGANFLHNHILHFYHLALPDYLDPGGLPAGLAGFLSPGASPQDWRGTREERERLGQDYLAALTMRRKAQELVALFGGKMPHDMAIVPGGVTYRPTFGDVEAFRFRLGELRDFIERTYFPDVLLLAKTYPDHFALGRTHSFLSYGGFPEADGTPTFPAGVILNGEATPFRPAEITEEVAHAWYAGDGGKLGESFPMPQVGKQGAYSWIKAPRFRGEPCEVGPAARLLVGLEFGSEPLRAAVEEGMRAAGVRVEELGSVAGRHLARAIEARYLGAKLAEWLEALDLRKPIAVPFKIPAEGQGVGLAEAPRGAVGHWIKIKGGKIDHYQVISPTTWNASPRDDRGKPGPLEEALSGTQVEGDGLALAGRIVRSFDPCLACAVQ